MKIHYILDKFNGCIKESLDDKRITQKEYAKRIKVSESCFSNYVTGIREMSYDTISRVSEDLNLDLNYIFKTKTKRHTVLDKDEDQLIKALRGLSDQERKIVYLGLNTLIYAIKNNALARTHCFLSLAKWYRHL